MKLPFVLQSVIIGSELRVQLALPRPLLILPVVAGFNHHAFCPIVRATPATLLTTNNEGPIVAGMNA
jgi:hypothetical protein